jgi:hypothetical protein
LAVREVVSFLPILLSTATMNSSFERIDKNIVFTYPYIGGPGFFSYQSYTFDFAEWITLLTLCLAPLLAHVITGVLSIAHLSHSRPRWHDILPLYHPTTIIWRYMILVDRRIRAAAWDVGDLAAANTVFWTLDGWAGDEHIVASSRRYLTRPPEIGRLRSLVSSETLGTVITTLQGLQAAYSMVAQVSTSGPSHSKGTTMADVFTWLSILGLLRVPAAAWVTNDFAYTYKMPKDFATLDIPVEEVMTQETRTGWQRIPSGGGRHENKASRFTQSAWQSKLLRSAFFACGIGITAYNLFITFIQPVIRYEKIYATTTNILSLPLYALLVSPTTILFGAHAFRKPEDGLSTIIPCAKTWWYKIYVIFWYLLAVSVVVIAAVETTIDRCGHYSSAPFQPLKCK